MAQLYDLPYSELQVYRPDLTRQSDFDDFWEQNKQELGQYEASRTLEPVDYPVDGINVYELTFRGFGGALIRGYYAIPRGDGPHPGLVLFHGYNWGMDGGIHEVVNWAGHGYAAFMMLCRGQQGSEDNLISPHGHAAGWMSKGILDKQTYYYRGVYMDAVRALEVFRDLPGVDGMRIGVSGGSQGGALSLVAAALSDVPVVCAADYPYLSHFRRAIDVAPEGPYLEINEFFRRNSSEAVEQKAMTTLSYFDVMNLASRINCPTFVSVGLVDTITPPSTVFASFNRVEAPKEIYVSRYFGHEFTSAAHMAKLQFLKDHLRHP